MPIECIHHFIAAIDRVDAFFHFGRHGRVQPVDNPSARILSSQTYLKHSEHRQRHKTGQEVRVDMFLCADKDRARLQVGFRNPECLFNAPEAAVSIKDL